MENAFAYWHASTEELYQRMHSAPEGLTQKEAERRFSAKDNHFLSARRRDSSLMLFFGQFKSPLILLLIFAAILSLFLSDGTDAAIILTIVFASALLTFFQERGARSAVQKLLSLVKVKAQVLRDGKALEIDIEEVVCGDIVLLSAGNIIPADCVILEARDCFADEATLTGESFHLEKREGILPGNTPLAQRSNMLFLGSHVVSGTAKAIVVRTGKETEFGKVAERLRFRPPETAFERGIRHLGFLLMEVTLLLVIAIFAFNVYLHRPVIESFLFSMALAVGLTPQLLPAIVGINLSHGARRMAKEKVIVKRLSSIENLGAMEILCADKTGTLTDGAIALSAVYDVEGKPSLAARLYAHLNAQFQTGYTNPIDQAILASDGARSSLSEYSKRDEIPYDFIRKRLSVLVKGPREQLLITKGALSHVLEICASVEMPSGEKRPMAAMKEKLEALFADYCSQGFRVLGVAYKPCDKGSITSEDENDLIFSGFLLFFDPPKLGMREVLAKMQGAKVTIKVITGDHALVAAHIAQEIGLLPARETESMEDYLNAHVLTGAKIHHMSNRALIRKAQQLCIFAELEPHQKERIILALRKAGFVVGYLGDGINDATALHAADVSISVDVAADVVREVADIVLLKKDLSVLLRGIQEGRKTFANTMKYIFMATSANFGNMFSMAGVSLLIPFLPLLPKQILFNNLLTDGPEMAIATDRVDKQILEQPVKWDMKFIRRFMLVFGLVSSLFDFLTFGVLLYVFKATPEVFRTAWFIESVVSASTIVLVVRTRKPFWMSRPSKTLALGVAGVVLFAFVSPWTPIAQLFGFVPLAADLLCAIAAIVVLYVVTAEIAKRFFFYGANGVVKKGENHTDAASPLSQA